MRPAPAIVGRMRVFVFDDACGPCTRAAAFLRRRAGAGAAGTDAAGASDGAGPWATVREPWPWATARARG
ncbi:Uncharacterised protein [Rothia kristinae]|nr:Uncharacterised protein [Rothia kristinae]